MDGRPFDPSDRDDSSDPAPDAPGPFGGPGPFGASGLFGARGASPAPGDDDRDSALPDDHDAVPPPWGGAPSPSPFARPGAATAAAPAATGATALLEDDDDEVVGLLARTPFAPGTGPRVNLVPGEVLTTRGVRRAQRRGVLVLLAAVLVVAAAWALVEGDRSMAREDLAAAQQRTVDLTAQQSRYARAPQVYAQVDDTRAALAVVMAGDVRWYQYLADLAVTSPPGLWLTSWTATAADPALAALDPALTATDPATGAAATAPAATLAVSGTATDEPDVADWLDVLSATPGLTGATASSLTRTAVGEQPVVTFDSSASTTAAALSDRYAVED